MDSLVYKFANLDGIGYFLEGKTLKFAPASAQNDVNEMMPNTSHRLNEVMETAAAKVQTAKAPEYSHLTPDQFLHTVYGPSDIGTSMKIAAVRTAWKLSHRLFETFGILSLTTTPDNILMWAHYTGTQNLPWSGLCIGFKPSARVFLESKHKGAGIIGIQEVKYSSSRATFGADSISRRIADIALTKSVDWLYENELRCIRELETPDCAIFVPFMPEDIQEIILGPNMPVESILRCIDLHAREFSHAKLFVALPNPEMFKMEIYVCPKEPKYVELAFQDPRVALGDGRPSLSALLKSLSGDPS